MYESFAEYYFGGTFLRYSNLVQENDVPRWRGIKGVEKPPSQRSFGHSFEKRTYWTTLFVFDPFGISDILKKWILTKPESNFQRRNEQ